jgi:DNA-binding cell septation regulator SpoVG
MNPPTLHDFRFTAANRIEQTTGLMGWIAFTVNGQLRVDGVTLRRTAEGRLTLAFPARVAADGRKRPIVWPPSEEARQAIESQVFGALHFDAGSTS